MLGIMFQKLLSKKWMFLCLLLGGILLIATAVSFPLYQNAAFDRMLRSEFEKRYAQTGEWPAKLSKTLNWNMSTQAENIRQAEEKFAGLSAELGVAEKESISFYSAQVTLTMPSGRMDANTDALRASFLSDLPDHADLLAGEMYSETGLSEEGYIEVVISQNGSASNNILIGDILEVRSAEEDSPIVQMLVTGIYRHRDDDPYWEIGREETRNGCFMQEELFRRYFLTPSEDNKYNIRAIQCCLFEYDSLKSESADHILRMVTQNKYSADACVDLLKTFQGKQPLLSATLLILQIPVLVLLAAFLFMVSGQMYELERNEISVIKSRGSSGAQIFRLYLYQNIFITMLSILLGIPLGTVFVRILGSASNFLEFELRSSPDIDFNARVLLFLAAAALLSLLIMTLPAIRYSKVSIVHLKRQKAAKKTALWEKFLLDFICLGISFYGFYNYSKNRNLLTENVLSGRSLDPLLYVCSSLFIVGAGLLFLRLQPLFVRLIFVMGKRFWRPAGYVCFLDNQKNGRKQQFIMLFLILTVSLGSFYATAARTILQNALKNTEYLDGTDLVVREIWKDNANTISSQKSLANMGHFSAVDDPHYYEPDFYKYSSLDAQSFTKVIFHNMSNPSGDVRSYVVVENEEVSISMMGIHTREFGETTWIDRNLTKEHYYTYLNLLADNPDGVLVSENFRSRYGYNVGDKLSCHYNSVMGKGDARIQINHSISLKIAGFIDYWPGYAPNIAVLDSSGEAVLKPNYLMVANYAALQEAFYPVTEPYEVWISLKDGVSSEDAALWIKENNVPIQKYVDRQADLQKTLEDPLLQGTNGILTMSFLVMILLCAVGYLIYWIMSIRSRELIFGTLRALGMHKKELFHILMLEQFFSGILSVLAGAGIGALASKMFVPILQMAYAASNQVLPILLYTNPQDMVRLYGTLAVMMAVCLVILVLLVLKLNITKALKLGEG